MNKTLTPALPNGPVILCENLSKTFVDGKLRVEVLKNINLIVKKHETLAIVGSSGSGKSTLLHLLGGLDKPSVGKVLIAGTDIHQCSESRRSQLRNQYLGFVYQFHHLLPEFTALENVCMPLLIGGVNKKLAQEKALSLIDLVGLSQRRHHKPSELSGGEKQRIAICRALVTEPACLLADEPTGNLDQKTATHVFNSLLHLNQQLNTSIIVVTHDLNLARQLNRRVELKNGVLTERELEEA